MPDRRAARVRGIALTLTTLVLVVFPAVDTPAAGTITGTVTSLAGGGGIAGAEVTVASDDQPPLTTTTAGDGTFSVDVTGSGPFGVSVQKRGFAGQTERGVGANGNVLFALDTATFTPVSADTGYNLDVAADARSGVFYTLVPAGPELFRTTNSGGSWNAVPMSYDDPDEGLVNGVGVSAALATSSVPGEVAVANNSIDTVSYSTDYGVTWRTLIGDFDPSPGYGGSPGAPRLFLHWGHAGPGADSVLLVTQLLADGSWRAWRADMTDASPALAEFGADPFGTDSQVDVADGTDGSFVGRVSAAGDLTFAPLTPSGDLTFGAAQVSGLPTPPQLLALGGVPAAGGPPDGVLVVGGSGSHTAAMLTKSGGTTFAGSSASNPTAVPANCQTASRPILGSVAPSATGTDGLGNAVSCWVKKSGTGTDLTFGPGPENGDVAFDADYGSGSTVVLFAGSLGPYKSSGFDGSGFPDFDGSVNNGISTMEVFDTAYGPSTDDQSLALFHQAMASTDGGQTVKRFADGRITWSTQWWQGADDDWLVFGHGDVTTDQPNYCDVHLTAFHGWNGTSTVSEPNVDGTSCADLSGGSSVWSLEPVEGTDKVFLGMDDDVVRGRLQPGSPPELTNHFSMDAAISGVNFRQARAMEYCPDSSAFADLRDVLFVAGGDDPTVSGSIIRITGATTSNPSGDVVPTAEVQAEDVRADCDSGIVYAVNRSQPAGLFKSADGGLSFTAVDVPGRPGQSFNDSFGGMTAVGLDPANPANVTVAAGDAGAVANSLDGGATWTMIRDPAVDRNASIHDLEYREPPVQAASVSDVSAQATGDRRKALVGTGAGAFRTDPRARQGIIGQRGSATGRPQGAVRLTALAADRDVSLVQAPPGRKPEAVFDRQAGLYVSKESSGSWSQPEKIPRTKRRDGLPVGALDAEGVLHVVFERRGDRPGIYEVRRSDGQWSRPRRISGSRGDTLPDVVTTGVQQPKTHVVFLRTRGDGEGILYAGNLGGIWPDPRRIPGTNGNDAMPRLGGPSLAATGGGLKVVFARGEGRPGIYFSGKDTRGWSDLARLTRRSGDVQPDLAVTGGNVRHVVFRRTEGDGRHGLFSLWWERGEGWSLKRLRGTRRADRHPAVAVFRSKVAVAFVRSTGSRPGLYFERRGADGWTRRPQRWSSNDGDHDPSLRLRRRARPTVVYERL